MPDKMIWTIGGNRYCLKPFPQMTGAFMKKFQKYINAGMEKEQLQITVSVQPYDIIKDVLVPYEGGTLPVGLEDDMSIEQQMQIIAELALDYTDFLTGGGSYFEKLLQKRKAMRSSSKRNTAKKEATAQT